MAEQIKPLSRSEREALIKDKAGWVITVLAAFLAINTLMGGSNSSKILNNTIEANNTWAFYESDPATGEGKKELMAKARKLEEDRAVAKSRSPWYTYSGSLFQIAIVLLTASILAVNIRLYWASIGVGLIAFISMSQAIWLWIPFM